MIHEDERRILEDWPEAKVITAKQDCILGDHYHKIKTEKFILVHGNATLIYSYDSGNGQKPMQKGVIYTVEPNVRHTFLLTAESVLVGLCSHPYDPTDDYR